MSYVTQFLQKLIKKHEVDKLCLRDMQPRVRSSIQFDTGSAVHVDRGPLCNGNVSRLNLDASVYPIPGITPAEFLNRYLNLRVYYIAENEECRRTAHASIEVYSNPHSGNMASNTNRKAEIDRLVWREISRRSRSRINANRTHFHALTQCLFGHGAPQHYQIHLSYALTHALVTPSGLENYCNGQNGAELGLDCIGFVNRYLMVSGRIPAAINCIGEEYGISHHRRWGTEDGKRMIAQEIQANDLIIHNDGNTHIAMVNAVSHDSRVLDVCESCSSCNGLVRRNWRVISGNEGDFAFSQESVGGRCGLNSRDPVWGVYPSR